MFEIQFKSLQYLLKIDDFVYNFKLCNANTRYAKASKVRKSRRFLLKDTLSLFDKFSFCYLLSFLLN